MFVFPLIFLISFFVAAKEVFNGNRQGILIFFIFGLSVYTTAMSVSFILGLKSLIPTFQFLKEIIVIAVLLIGVFSIRSRPKFHVLDYSLFLFLMITGVYAILPIGEQGLVNRFVALKSTSFFVIVYFAGRFINLKSVYINQYFSYIVLITIAAGVVLLGEVGMNLHLQSLTGYADYSYYFFNFEPSGHFGLSWTFESEGGYKRFASFFANPLEHAAATLLALAIIFGLYTDDRNRFKFNNLSMLALAATFLSILFAISRAPLAGYGLMIYVYALLTKRKVITKSVHAVLAVAALYLVYLFTRFEQNNTGLIEVVMNTVDFSNPSSVGHLVEWIQGIISMINHPFGIGLGTSGRVGGTLGENIGGENQFIIIGVQAGVQTLILYLFIYVVFIRTGIKWFNILKGKERKLCIAVLLFKIGIMLPLFTSEVESSSYISYMNWFLSGLFVSVIMQPTIKLAQVAYDH